MRDFGDVLLSTPFNGQCQLTKILVQEGWVKVKPVDSRLDANE